MLGRSTMPDKSLLKKVNQRLIRAGLGSSCSVSASIRNGQVTLIGNLEREGQRRSVLRAASGVDGVRMVVDQLKIQTRTRFGK